MFFDHRCPGWKWLATWKSWANFLKSPHEKLALTIFDSHQKCSQSWTTIFDTRIKGVGALLTSALTQLWLASKLSCLWLESKVSKGTFDARASHIWQNLWSLLIRVKGVSHLTKNKYGLWFASKVIKGMVKYGLWLLWHMAKAWCKGNFSCSEFNSCVLEKSLKTNSKLIMVCFSLDNSLEIFLLSWENFVYQRSYLVTWAQFWPIR